MISIAALNKMKLPELKKRVWRVWTRLNSWKGELTSVPERYVEDVRRFGDRRYKQTWVKALARFEAIRTYETCLDGWALIAINFNFTPTHRNYEFRHEIIDEFLMYPDGLEMIRDGLEQLFSSDFSHQERENVHGFYSLVEERERQHRGIGISVGPVATIAGASAAT